MKIARKTAAMRAATMISQMEQLGLAEYVTYLRDKRQLFMTNFMAGIARGVGIGVGFTIIGAMLLAVLQRLAASNLPGISNFIADVIRIVQMKL